MKQPLFPRAIHDAFAWTAVVALSCAVALPQNTMESQTVLHSTARLVLVDVHVGGPDGAPVQGLSKDHFEVKEDGVRQLINGFDEHSPKIDRSGLPPLDFQLPAHTFVNLEPAVSNGPLCVIVFDHMNTSLDSQMFAYGQIIKFLQNKDAGTEVALFALGDRLTLLQGFTTDMRRLIAAMNSPAGHPKLTSWGNNSDLSKDCTVIARRFQAAQRTLDAFVDLGQFLAAAPGRKNLLWFSSSFQALPLPTSGDFEKNIQLDSSSNSPFDFLSNSPDQISNCTPSYKILSERLRKVSTELAVSQTAVYPIDTRGLKSEPADYGGSGSESQPENGKGDNSTLAEKTVAWIHFLDASQATMREIAEATGGEAFVNTNNLARAASRAVDMGSYYYTLSYSPANAKFDGSLRRIRVSLRKRDSKQNYQLTYRTAYYADDPDRAVPVSVRQDALEAALVHGEPNAHSILFKVQIDPAGAEKPAPQAEAPAHGTKESAKAVPEKVQTYDLRFSILASQMNLATSADGRSRGALDIAVAAYAADGRRLGGSKQHLEAAIPSPLIDKTSDEGFFHRMRVDVPVNAAGIRVVVRDPTSGRVGSVEIAVPL